MTCVSCGEPYAQSVSTGVTDISFAGNNEDTTTNLYDAQNCGNLRSLALTPSGGSCRRVFPALHEIASDRLLFGSCSLFFVGDDVDIHKRGLLQKAVNRGKI